MVNYTYWLWDGVMSKEFCEFMLKDIDWDKKLPAGVELSNQIVPEKRITEVVWQNSMQPLGCIAQTFIASANTKAEWNYPLSRPEDTQIGKYIGEQRGHYDWHMDSFPPINGIQRKISCVILLNDPESFEGGQLQLKGVDSDNLLTKQGSIIVFPSFIEHRVTPVTKGERISAVSWASGPAFR